MKNVKSDNILPKIMKSKIVVVAFILPFLVLLSCFNEQINAEDINVNTLISNLKNAQKEIKTFQGILKVSGSVGNQTFEVFTKGEDKLYAVYKVEFANIETSSIMVCNGNTVYGYHPTTNLVTKDEIKTTVPSHPSMRSFMFKLIESLSNGLVKKEINDEDNEFCKITILGDNDNKWIYWISKEDWLIHKQESFVKARNETLIIVHQWEDIKINEDIPDSMFDFVIPEGVEIIDNQTSEE